MPLLFDFLSDSALSVYPRSREGQFGNRIPITTVVQNGRRQLQRPRCSQDAAQTHLVESDGKSETLHAFVFLVSSA